MYCKNAINRSAAALLFSITLLCATGVAHAEWFADAESDAVFNSNLSRAFDKHNRKGDIAFVPHVLLGQFFQLTDSLALSLTTDAGSSVYTKYDGLNNINAGLAASLKYKHGMGAYAPWLKGYGSLKYFLYNESIRDGALFTAGLLTGKRLHERINLQLGYEHQRLHARNSLFSRLSEAASVKADFAIVDALQLMLGYSITKGDVEIYNSPDEDSGFLADTFNTPMEVYKVRGAATYTTSIGLSLAMSGHLSADFAAYFNSVHSRYKSYPGSILKAGIHYSY